eukprot:TRINITY_DN58750_c0_g1_i1.p1 TRINITY_DN58750_c0_g1~~TRINITY_DN58750_c0_g1_i1.p1  ORF type:complete len:280 (+),score=12.19 TRINITY_DN58750_c0_g1_i1:59-841(+)
MTSSTVASFKNGLEAYCNRIAQVLGDETVKIGWRVDRIERLPNGHFLASVTTRNGPKEIVARYIAMALPANATARLLKGVLPISRELTTVGYSSVASVTVAYPMSTLRDVNMTGFGHLIPRSEGLFSLGVIWSSLLFPDGAPAGKVILRSFIGRMSNLDAITDPQLVSIAHNDLIRCKVLRNETRLEEGQLLSIRRWNNGIPQPAKGHRAMLERLEAQRKELTPNIFIGGMFKSGVSFGDCIQFGVETAKSIAASISKNR